MKKISLSKLKAKRFKPTKLLLIFILVFTNVFGFIQPSPAGADATRTKIMRYEALRGLIGKCAGAGGLYLNDEISRDQFADPSYSPLTVSQANINVPNLLFDTTSVTCAKALSLYYGGALTGDNLEEQRQAFIKQYYDTSPANPPFGLKKSADATAADLLSAVRAYMLSLVAGDTTAFNSWRDRIISQDFNDCWKWEPANPANTPTDISKATDAQKKDPKNWGEEDHNTPSNNVGWMAEKEITGTYLDGRVSCDEVKAYIFPNHTDLIGFGNDDLANDLKDEAKAAAAAALAKIFYEGNNSDKVVACAAAAGMSSDTPLNLYDIAAWLAYNDDSHTIPSGGGDLNKFKACLVSQITGVKDTLTGLDQDIAKIEQNVADAAASGGGDDTTKDACLSKTNQFIGWFACPLINMIDDLLKGILDIMKDLFKFNITGSLKNGNVNENDYLKDSWNIFRALSTILIMGGFLLALLIKGIKGE